MNCVYRASDGGGNGYRDASPRETELAPGWVRPELLTGTPSLYCLSPVPPNYKGGPADPTALAQYKQGRCHRRWTVAATPTVPVLQPVESNRQPSGLPVRRSRRLSK